LVEEGGRGYRVRKRQNILNSAILKQA